MTRLIITFTATGERLQLRRTKIKRSHNSYAQVWFHLMDDGGIHSRLVLAVGKSQDLLVERHDVQNRLLLPPPANRSSFSGILQKAAPAESFREISISGI